MIKKLALGIIILIGINQVVQAQNKMPQSFDKWLGLWKSTNLIDTISLFIIHDNGFFEKIINDSINHPDLYDPFFLA